MSELKFPKLDVTVPTASEFMQETLGEIGLDISILVNRATDGNIEWSIEMNKATYPNGVPIEDVIKLLTETAEKIIEFAEAKQFGDTNDEA